MKLIRVLYVVLLLAGLKGFGQVNGFAEAYTLESDTESYIQLPDKHWQYKIYDHHFPSFQQVASSGGFADPKVHPQVQLHQQIWLRYKIKNALSKPVGITIPALGQVMTTYISVNGGTFTADSTGIGIPYSRRGGYKRIAEIASSIPAHGELTVYQQYRNTFAGMSVVIGIEKNVVKQQYVNNDTYFLSLITGSVMFGIFLMAFIINAFFYVVVKERVYLWYCLTLLFSAFTYFYLAWRDFLLRDYPTVMKANDFLNVVLLFATFIVTALLFLRASKNYPKVYKAAIALNIIFVLSGIYSIFFSVSIYSVAYLTMKYMRFALLFIILAILVADLFKKRGSAIVFSVAIFPFIVCYGSAVFITERGLGIKLFTNFTVIWAVIVMSWTLFNRFKYLQAENARQALERERLAREQEEERNALIAQQNELLEIQVAERTAELQQSIQNLKLTQNQLIQSEKMASLGELTAGIAHEIQNPLNFVNNFSDVSVELIDELKEELVKGDIEEATAIAGDLTLNLEKIAHHGRRADGIVKGMLQHSRTSSGQKEPADINALADEYLRLAYHGLRAKDKSFNADLVTNFAEGLTKPSIIPQDVGRVLLNLFTNAFYATNEKSKQYSVASGQSQQESYKPKVEVTTKQEGNSIIISVKDNGTGIPDAIKDKILQPFFTTKPTGEGTGLGLSLSYDIIVKGHGGTIDINSSPGEGADFVIKLPLA